MTVQNSGVNLNAQKLPADYQEQAKPELVQTTTASKTKAAEYNDAKRVGVVSAPNVPNDPLKDEFTKEKMQSPGAAVANQQLIGQVQRKANFIKIGATALGVGALAYFTLIRKTGFLSIRKLFNKNSKLNTAEQLKKFTEDLITTKSTKGIIKAKSIPNEVKISFTETGITNDAKKEAIENIYKIAREVSQMKDAKSGIYLSFSQGTKTEVNQAINKIKEGKVNELSEAVLNRIENIVLLKVKCKNNISTDILTRPVSREVFDVSKGSEAWSKFTKDAKDSIKGMLVDI